MGEGGGTTSGIVGRDGERVRLRAALAAAQSGEPRVVVVEGAMIGKTSLVADFGTLDVTATNYQFDGIAARVPAWTTIVNFDNGGTEFHEMALVRIDEGEERSLEELLAPRGRGGCPGGRAPRFLPRGARPRP
jgi:hypothetical protein